MKFAAYVAINETGLIEGKPVGSALSDFASTAQSIIALFDS